MPSGLSDENATTPASPRAGLDVGTPRELLSGLDALDLTCKSPAPRALLAELGELKAQAGEDVRAAVWLDVGDQALRVASSGMGAWWPFRLDHQFGKIAVGESANRPAWRVSVAAEALHAEGPARVVAFWQSIIETLTGGPAVLMVSRLDVHADFAGLAITDADRSSFVCRSGRQSVEFTHGNLETLYWGKGGDVVVRVYDKLAEVKATGNGGYLLDAYSAAGLVDGDQVQRVEAQVRAKVLRQMNIATVDQALAHGGAVYAYVVDKWLRLTVPGSATRRERADLDPRRLAVQRAAVAAGIDPAGRRLPERHTPGLDVIIPTLTAYLVHVGRQTGLTDLHDALTRTGHLVAGYLEDKHRDFAGEVRAGRLDPSVA